MIKFAPLFFASSFAMASILPENNLAIPLSDKMEGLSEVQYHLVIDKVENTYRPLIEEQGFKLTLKRLWSDPRVNAGTTKKGKEWIINLYGGYARHPQITEDGYGLVICHELGHHLGGSPKKIFDSGEIGWPSVEGQADYFATLKCLRKVFAKDDNERIISAINIPSYFYEKCSLAFKNSADSAICMRTVLAGIAVSAISADIRNTRIPSVQTPDLSIVERTYEAHPLPQCRLDTYFQGSICPVSSSIPLALDDERKGTCHKTRGHQEGLRPACWFKPSQIKKGQDFSWP